MSEIQPQTPTSEGPATGRGWAERDLESEMPWLRGLARALAGGGLCADDLVQDTLLVAGTERGPVRNLRGFLAGTLRRIASRRRRSEARRRGREGAVASSKATGGTVLAAPTDALAERVDLLRVALAEVHALPPSQRRAVTLRFLDGLDPSEIAEREGISPSTARSHVARGLEAVRQRLDQRSGSRGGWVSCFAAWPALRIEPAAAVAAVAAPSTGAALGAAGMLVMFSKTTLAVSLPILAATAWWFARSETVEQHAVVRSEETPVVASDTLADVDDLAIRREPDVVPARPESPAPDRAAGGGEESAGVPPGTLVVDALTEDPVPDLALYFELDRGGETVSVVTDASGALATEGRLAANGAVAYTSRDDQDVSFSRPQRMPLQLPVEAPLRVSVGPTFFVDVALPEGLAEADFLATFTLEGAERSFSRFETSLREAHEPGGLPWVRFPAGVVDLAPTEPWRVVLQDKRGQWFGSTAAPRTVGVEPTPLVIELSSLACVEFRVIGQGSSDGSVPSVKLTRTADGEEQRVLLGTHSDGNSTLGRAKFLRPGRYLWSFAGGPDGELELAAGDVELVEVRREDLAATFSTWIDIDTSKYPDARPGEWFVLVGFEAEAGVGFMTRPGAAPSGTSFSHRVKLDGLSDGRWTVAFSAESGGRVEPSTVSVGPGDPPPVVRALPPLPKTRLRIRVVDAETEVSIEAAEVGWSALPGGADQAFRSDDSEWFATSVPAEQPVILVARSAGYRTVAESLAPGGTEGVRELTLRLERGWRERVVVVDALGQQPIPGVVVLAEGQAVGETDAEGALWIEGEGPPKRLEIDAATAGLTVLQSPMQSPLGTGTVDVFGYLFIVTRG